MGGSVRACSLLPAENKAAVDNRTAARRIESHLENLFARGVSLPNAGRIM